MGNKYKILVCIKQVPDTNAILRLENGIPVYDEKTVYVINRYDEYALEEALQLKDHGLALCIHTISIGPQRIQKALRRSLEMGADEAFHIIVPEDITHTPAIVSQAIVQFAQQNYDIIFTGVMSEDAMNQQTGQLIAALLHYNYATGVTELSPHNNVIKITRELNTMESMRYELQLPCVIAVQSSLHKPRYPSLSNVLRARKQEINIITLDQITPNVTLNCYFSMPHKITQCHFIEGNTTKKVTELYTILHKNAVL
ncbi:MAG: electron transfer flavoprotein subunit beta/FixA family protein [Spirochaetes bacterium]|nr:electron transfer flavoprotein subunit beta/FixA family protein [Spirochaetota bacterium]